MNFSNYGPIPEQALAHLRSENPNHFERLDNLSEDMTVLNDQAELLLLDLQEHMMTCGSCLGTLIASGMLITIEDYWQNHPVQVNGVPSYLLLNFN